MGQYLLGALNSPEPSVGSSLREAAFVYYQKATLARTRGEVDASNKNVFFTCLSSDPNGAFGDIQHKVLTRRSWYRFSDAANTALNLPAFPEGFLAANGSGIVQDAVVEPGFSNYYGM